MDAQGTLIIQGVAPEDAGDYSCQAANEVGTDEETVTLYYTGTGPRASQERGLHPALPPIHRYLLSVNCVPGTGGTAVTPRPCLGAAYILTGRHKTDMKRK